jgi:hypothetical protein
LFEETNANSMKRCERSKRKSQSINNATLNGLAILVDPNLLLKVSSRASQKLTYLFEQVKEYENYYKNRNLANVHLLVI